jgi:hypothetical protein
VIGFLLTVAAIFACGLAVSDRLWRGESDLGPAERVLSGALVGMALWLAASWLLAVAHLLTRPALIGVAVAMGMVGAVLRSSLFVVRRSTKNEQRTTSFLLVLSLLLWTLFALWKGYVLPPQSHDALAMHLPKAVMMARAHGFEHFVIPDGRVAALPANYELLLADVLVMSGGDTLTEWINTITFLLFLCAAAAMSERWWGAQAHRAATALAVASAPLLLLHSTADKNDILLCFLAVCALLWGARWCAHGGKMPMLLTIVALAIAGGTKPNAAAVFVALVPFLLMRWRSVRARDLAATAAVAALAFLLLGGIAYIDIVRHAGAPMAVKVAGVKAGGGLLIEWGDFANLWQVPYLILTVPFVPRATAVWVPWRGEFWYWPHYEIFFSHYGALITILAILAPFCAWRIAPSRERFVATAAAGLAAAIILPLHMLPQGMAAASMPRYVAFLLPIIVCWSVPPLIDGLRARATPLLANTFAAAIVAFFLLSAIDVAVNDRFAPLPFVRWAAQHPGTRQTWFIRNRAALIVDRHAGPNDTIAIDGGFDTWSYPAFGAHLTRRVIFLPDPATPNDVPPDARWVVIDRSWNRIWEDPRLTDMGKFWQYVGHGKPLPQDTRLLLALEHDPRFALVFYDPRANQAVFERVR